MIKICNHELSSDQCSQLSGGLSFVLFKNDDPLTTGVELFKFLSTFTSQINISSVETFCRLVERDVRETSH